ncbi:MAG: ComF family protein [Parcubacteria group bacterium]|nr:ComF family protein [Parcubacteria group bacterium]
MEDFLFHMRQIFLDSLFPKVCLGCNREVDFCCTDCIDTVSLLPYQICPVCYQQNTDGVPCRACEKTSHLDRLLVAVSYEQALVKKLLLAFKYEYVEEIATVLALYMRQRLLAHKVSLRHCDAILIPIPLHRQRLRDRGFNQSERLALALIQCHVPAQINTLALIRTHYRSSQVTKIKKEREISVHGVFACVDSSSVRGRNIMLVDDVYSTGATMQEAAKVLKKVGAKSVMGLALCRGE